MPGQKDELMAAIRNGKSVKVKSLLEAAKSATNVPAEQRVHADMEADGAKNTVLHRAARWGHAKVVEVLLEAGADPNRTNKFNMTPLHHAANHGSPEVMSALIKAGGDAKKVDDEQRAPLHFAAGHALGPCVKVLLEEGGAKPNAGCKRGFTPLHLDRMPEAPKKKQEEQETWAKMTEEQKQIQIEKKISEEDDLRHDIVRMLLKHGGNAKQRQPASENTPLHLCAMNGYAKAGEVLIIDGKAEIDSQNKLKQTPLMYATTDGHLPMVQMLIKHKADPNIKNTVYWDWTPLHYAIMRDEPDLVKILLDGGADPNQIEGTGQVAKVVASDNYKNKVIHLL